MQEIRQLDPQDQADIAAAFQDDGQGSARMHLSASPNVSAGKQPLTGSPAQSVSPDRSQSHAAASSSSPSDKVHNHLSERNNDNTKLNQAVAKSLVKLPKQRLSSMYIVIMASCC